MPCSIRAGGTQDQALQMARAGADLTAAAHLMLEGNLFDEVLAAAQRGEIPRAGHHSHSVLAAPAVDEPHGPAVPPRRQQGRRPVRGERASDPQLATRPVPTRAERRLKNSCCSSPAKQECAAYASCANKVQMLCQDRCRSDTAQCPP